METTIQIAIASQHTANNNMGIIEIYGQKFDLIWFSSIFNFGIKNLIEPIGFCRKNTIFFLIFNQFLIFWPNFFDKFRFSLAMNTPN